MQTWVILLVIVPAVLSSAEPPETGSQQQILLSPTTLELTDYVAGPTNGTAPALSISAPQDFTITCAGKNVPVTEVGFKRRVVYAPLRVRDLRVANHVYLQLASPIIDGSTVTVHTARQTWTINASPQRFSPAIHINQTGYLPAGPKTAFVGYFLGSLGELAVPAGEFRLLNDSTGKTVFSSQLVARPDDGFTFPCYQQVLEADFSKLTQPGTYRLQVPGIGVSEPFAIADDVAGAFARVFALGLYHQRCGTANELPFTRFVHGPCHTAPAAIATKDFSLNWRVIADVSSDFNKNPRHTAPQLRSPETALYPFVNTGPINVAGGHHDAGDYSKYTINSAALIHRLVFAADNFPGVAALDNLGLPESGDGKSDVLQEAKWEADFLTKMQDADGGFYFLVYPQQRRYENDVLPDRGDPQVVWPKNTAATASAVAALAQTASSPAFKRQFPEAAARYLQKARQGWAFLERAIAAHGKDGSYQKLTHYGDVFMHDDELAWAACEMFLATGEQPYHDRLREGFDPADQQTRIWTWVRLSASYGNAIRSYAFAARSGRVNRDQLDEQYLIRCENQITAAGRDQLDWAEASAYGTSLPFVTKRFRSPGWYFSTDAAFDLATAHLLADAEHRLKLWKAILSNLNYTAGCNPVNVSYITGLGRNRPVEIVHQYAANDRRQLPPSGLLIGNIQEGLGWLDLYQRLPADLSFPSDGDKGAPYPFYDRWVDGWNLSTEATIVNQASALAVGALLMAQTPLKNQPWRPVKARIVRTGKTPTLEAPGVDLRAAQITWETGDSWIEAEATLPDGRRVFAATAR